MKKLLFTLVLLLGVVSNTFAQKKNYVIAICTGTTCKLYGAVPEGVDKSKNYSIDDTFSLLTDDGYVLDKITSHSYGYPIGTGSTSSSRIEKEYIVFAFVKDEITTTNAKGIKVESYDDADVHEVARYNLQGMPVDTTEKGIQIVVYSNYTTKTVIVE